MITLKKNQIVRQMFMHLSDSQIREILGSWEYNVVVFTRELKEQLFYHDNKMHHAHIHEIIYKIKLFSNFILAFDNPDEYEYNTAFHADLRSELEHWYITFEIRDRYNTDQKRISGLIDAGVL